MKIYIICIIILFASCNPCKYVAKHPECYMSDSVIITETKTETITKIVLEPDSLSMKFLFECDSNNNVLIRENSELKTKGLNVIYRFKNNTLDLSVFTDSIEHLNKLIEITKGKEVIKMNPINDVLKAENEKLLQKNKLKGKLLVFMGGLLALAIVLFKILK